MRCSRPLAVVWTLVAVLASVVARAQDASSLPDQPQQQLPAPQIEPVRTSITVTEKISAETAAQVTDISGEELDQTPGQNLDDRLKVYPGFSLYRRTSSEIANPTTQGISLRGIGSSGASRTLVLYDGVPVNDPFGGWIYWTRFTPEDLARVEVSEGASTAVFGNLALGGVIDIIPVEPTPGTLHVSAGAEAGTQNTYDVFGDLTKAFRNWAFSAAGRGFTTEGYYVTPDTVRGAVDRKANVRFVNDTLRVDGFQGPHRLYAWVNSVVEERGNGTALTHNSTAEGTAALRYLLTAAHDSFSATAFGTSAQFHSTYSSVTNNRNTEKLVERQTVPEDVLGAALAYTHAGNKWDLTAGADADQVHGFSTDRVSATNVTVAGGTLTEHAEYLQADGTLGPVKLFAGGRDQFTAQGAQIFEPSGGFSVGRHGWRARGAAYRSFRTPTLNELFRDFRVGNTNTLPNAHLQPETLLGAEVGLDYLSERGAIRITAYRNDLRNLITNVTLSSTKTTITRERENAGDAIDRGFEIKADHTWGAWRAEAGYLFADARYSSGLRVAQVPKNQGSATLTWLHKGTLASASVRSYASQFDDDQNQFLLPGFAVVDFLAKQKVWRGLDGVLEATNILNHVIYTGFTPSPTIGEPAIVRAGLQIRWDK